MFFIFEGSAKAGPFFMSFFSVGFFGLFITSFLSATILPLSSEGILLLMLHTGFNPIYCLFVATAGNTLGGLTNYWIGSLGNPEWLKKIGVRPEKLHSFEVKIKKHGAWLAFFSWVPIIGDPLSVALGFFHVNWWKVAVLLFIGKLLRYALFCSFYF